jgi:hypothetical protein
METRTEMDGRASKTKSAFRMEYAAGVNIQASVERLWSLMTNSSDFPRWNTTVKSIEGQIAAGQTIKLVATVAPNRVFNLNIVEFAPQQKMVWSDGNAMFKGVRTYTFSAKPNNSTDFTMSEVYTGFMLPMIAGSLPNFSPIFAQYLADLKREAEKAG